MGFNDQAKNIGGRGARKFIFKDGVRFKHMTGAQPIIFRLMPAFNPNDPNPGTSYLPCLDPAGNLTDWGMVLKIVRFVGHGKGGAGTRQDLLSLKTFETDAQKVWCPLDAVYQAIMADTQVWGYLVEDKGDRKDKNRERQAYGRAAQHLVCNILDINQTQQGVQLGVFSAGASAKLIDRKDGLVFQPNAAPNAEEMIKQNYIWGYANGDVTCPQYAPVLLVEKGDDKGDYSSYKVTIAQDNSRRIIRRPVDQAMMAQRYNLTNLTGFINIPTEDELVQALIQLLNGRSPMGYHEHALLKMALPQCQIPDPPMAPAATATIASGFAPSAGAAGIPGMVPPTMSIPGMAPAPAGMGAYPAQPAPAQYGAPQYQSAPVPGVPAIPGMVPPTGGGFGTPAMPSATVPGAAPVPPVGYPPAPAVQMAPPPVTMAPGVPQGNQAPEMGGVAANIQAAGAPTTALPVAEVPAPGDQVAPGWTQADFLSRVRTAQPGK